MDKKKVKEEWRAKSEELNAGIANWRQEHPQAMFREIEAEIDRRMDEYRARMLSDTANMG